MKKKQYKYSKFWRFLFLIEIIFISAFAGLGYEMFGMPHLINLMFVSGCSILILTLTIEGLYEKV